MPTIAAATATASRIHPHGVDSSVAAATAVADGSGAGVVVAGATVVTVIPVGAATGGAAVVGTAWVGGAWVAGGAWVGSFVRVGTSGGFVVLTAGGSLVGGRVNPVRVDDACGEKVCERKGDEDRSGSAAEPLPEQAAARGTTAIDTTSATRTARRCVIAIPSLFRSPPTQMVRLPDLWSHHPRRVNHFDGGHRCTKPLPTASTKPIASTTTPLRMAWWVGRPASRRAR